MLKLASFAILLLAAMVCAQKPCCAPEQFIAGRGATVGSVSDGGPEGYYTYAYGAFDFFHQRFGFFLNIDYPGGNSTNFRLIQEYGQDKQWIIDDVKKTCQVERATRPQPSNCMPANATYSMSMTFGGLLAETWLYEYRYPKVPDIAYITAAVEYGTCNPIGGSLIGDVFGPAQTSIPMVTTYSVMNMTLGIPDPDKWFTLPSFCTQDVRLSNKDNDVHSRRPRSVSYLQAYHMPTFF